MCTVQVTVQLPHFLVTEPTPDVTIYPKRPEWCQGIGVCNNCSLLALPCLEITCWEHTVRPQTHISISDCNTEDQANWCDGAALRKQEGRAFFTTHPRRRTITAQVPVLLGGVKNSIKLGSSRDLDRLLSRFIPEVPLLPGA